MRIEPLFKSTILLVLVLSGSLIGATVVRGQTTVSFQAGASFATWGGDYAKEAENAGLDVGYRTGVAIRASAVLPLTDLLGLQIGAAYVHKGMSSQARGGDFARFIAGEQPPELQNGYFESTVDMGYLEFPALLRISPQLEGPLSPYVTAGPALSFALNCSVSSSISLSYTDPVTGENVRYGESESEECEEDEYKTFDFVVKAGAGLAFALSPSLSLTLDLMYNHGLMSIIEDDENTPDAKNRTFAIMVGLAVPIR